MNPLRRPPPRPYMGRLDEVTDRWLRRYTGPWQTKHRNLGPLTVEHRFRFRPNPDLLRFAIARQHAWHALRPDLLRLLRWLSPRSA